MKGLRFGAIGVAALSFVGCASGSEDSALGLRPENGAQLSGAIFTTNEEGTRVNQNHFECKQDVYIDGGPPENAPSTSAALPEGTYYFQVTNPSGSVLLSETEIECRDFYVNEFGVIEEYDPDGNCATPHDTGIDEDHEELGAITVGLYPYATTPNPGGVYKVWVTPEEDYEPGEGKHGFIPSRSKTDNFKAGVCEEEKKGTIKACKYRDKNEDGYVDAEDEPLPNWPITLSWDSQSITRYTNEWGCVIFDDLREGDYTVSEETFEFDGFVWTPTGPISVDVHLDKGEFERVNFTNVCVDVCYPDTEKCDGYDYGVKHDPIIRECPPPSAPDSIFTPG